MPRKTARAGGRASNRIQLSASAVVVYRARRNIAFRNVAVDGGTLALLRVAITAAPGRLHQKAFPGLHLVAPRRQRFAFVGRAEPHHEPAASARPTAGKPLWGKARF